MRVKEKNGSDLHRNKVGLGEGLDQKILEEFSMLTDENKIQVIDSAIAFLFEQAASSSGRPTGTEADP